MEADPFRPRLILTEQGVGYRLQIGDVEEVITIRNQTWFYPFLELLGEIVNLVLGTGPSFHQMTGNPYD